MWRGILLVSMSTMGILASSFAANLSNCGVVGENGIEDHHSNLPYGRKRKKIQAMAFCYWVRLDIVVSI